MTVLGHVKNGVIVPDKPICLPEWAAMQIAFVGNGTSPAVETTSTEGAQTESATTLLERLKPFVGCLKDLPPDFSINHDHYLYGTEKRK